MADPLGTILGRRLLQPHPLPVVHLVDELENALGKPVIACNAASYWQALREMGIDDKIHGFGRLLAEY